MPTSPPSPVDFWVWVHPRAGYCRWQDQVIAGKLSPMQPVRVPFFFNNFLQFSRWDGGRKGRFTPPPLPYGDWEVRRTCRACVWMGFLKFPCLLIEVLIIELMVDYIVSSHDIIIPFLSYRFYDFLNLVDKAITQCSQSWRLGFCRLFSGGSWWGFIPVRQSWVFHGCLMFDGHLGPRLYNA